MTQGEHRPCRLDGGGDRLDNWLHAANEADKAAVYEALFAIQDGTWRDRFAHSEDVTRQMQHVIQLGPELVIVAKFFVEYPTSWVLIYIGPPDMH